jgi:hypothetical protein
LCVYRVGGFVGATALKWAEIRRTGWKKGECIKKQIHWCFFWLD